MTSSWNLTKRINISSSFPGCSFSNQTTKVWSIVSEFRDPFKINLELGLIHNQASVYNFSRIHRHFESILHRGSHNSLFWALLLSHIPLHCYQQSWNDFHINANDSQVFLPTTDMNKRLQEMSHFDKRL